MNLGLVRDSSGNPKFSDVETVKFFWDRLSTQDKRFLVNQFPELLANGRTANSELYVKVPDARAARAVWNRLSTEQKRLLIAKYPELAR